MPGFILRKPDSSLTLNSNNHQHYIVEKSEKKGIQDLRQLALKTGKTDQDENEEHWLYLEGKDDTGKVRSFWFEAGINEGPHKVEVDYKAYPKILEFLKSHKITPTRGVGYHYHPLSKPIENEGPLGFLPSPADLKGQPAVQYNWKALKMPGAYSSAIVTSRGLWRSQWIGKPINRYPLLKPLQKKISKEVTQAYRYRDLELTRCVKRDSGFCQELYKSMGTLVSNASLKVFYQPFPKSGIKPASFQLVEGVLLAKVKASKHDPFFKMIRDHLQQIKKGLKGNGYQIRMDDPETWVSAEVTENHKRKVRFNYAIDNNSDPTDGRIYLTDTFYFSKKGNHLPGTFFRSFNYFRKLTGNKPFQNLSHQLEKLRRPSKDQQKNFAQKVAKTLLPTLKKKLKQP